MEREAYETSIFDEEQQPVIYAGFWDRLIALILDGLILLPLSFFTTYTRNYWYNTAVIVMTGLVALIYKPLLEYLYGATLGKKAMSIVVTNKMYEKPNLQEAVLRNIFGIVSSIIGLSSSFFVVNNAQFDQAGSDFDTLQRLVGYPLVAGSMLFFAEMADIIVFIADKQNKALHDFIGKTYVIKK